MLRFSYTFSEILRHCGLPLGGPKGWQDPPPRGPPDTIPSCRPCDQAHGPDSRLTHEVDPDFLEFARREEIEEPEPTLEPRLGAPRA